MWTEQVARGQISYRINRDHPAVQAASSEPTRKSVSNVLKLVEATVPVPRITINAAERHEDHASAADNYTPKMASELASDIYRMQIANGLSHREAVDVVLRTDPFHLFPELHELLDQLHEETSDDNRH